MTDEEESTIDTDEFNEEKDKTQEEIEAQTNLEAAKDLEDLTWRRLYLKLNQSVKT